MGRIANGVRTMLRDPVERRAYLARLKFLMSGTEGVQAWSLEYRSELTGRFLVPLARLSPAAEQVIRCEPTCAAGSPLSHLYEQRFVYQLHDTIASTASGATLMCATPEPAFFIRESIAWPFESVLAHGLEIPNPNGVEERFTGPQVVFPTTRNYYHWLVEDLPLVLRARQAVPACGLLSFSTGITDRHRLVADHLGMQLTPAPLIVQLDEQVLPGRASDSFFVHPDDLSMLNDLGVSLSAASQPERASYPGLLYVSRSRSRRPLADEQQLEAFLSAAGFEVVHLEDTPWIEQIRLFQNARVLAGPHGAGLSNLVFARPGTIVIELTVGYMFNRCFEWISHVGGHRYLPIEADSQPGVVTPEELGRAVLALSEHPIN